MKKFLISLLTLVSAITVAAQDQDQSRLGVRLSWDLNSPSTNYEGGAQVYGNGSGFSLGAFYDIPLYKALYFEPGLSFFYNTIGMPDIQIIPESPELRTTVIDGSLRNVGFRIPMVAGYRFDFTDDIALSVFTGPQLNIGLSMKYHLNLPSYLKDTEENNIQEYGNGFHRLDMQWLFGVRFHYQNNFIAELSGGPGMTDLLGKEYKQFNKLHLRRNIFSISVGYIF